MPFHFPLHSHCLVKVPVMLLGLRKYLWSKVNGKEGKERTQFIKVSVYFQNSNLKKSEEI